MKDTWQYLIAKDRPVSARSGAPIDADPGLTSCLSFEPLSADP